MSLFGTLIMGPAGAGKTTFSTALINHLKVNKRPVYYVNLDPAAEEFGYEPDLDIRELVTLEDAMTELMLGPNGGLTYCFEFLAENMDFLTEPLSNLTDEYLVIFDMPGQIELYTHMPVVPNIVRQLTGGSCGLHMRLCAAYLLESTFVLDRPKFFAGAMSAMSAMLMMELPHVNILSKTDLLKERGISRKHFRRFLNPDMVHLDSDMTLSYDNTKKNDGDGGVGDKTAAKNKKNPRVEIDSRPAPSEEDMKLASQNPLATQVVTNGTSFMRLNSALARLLDDFSLLSFLELDVRSEDSLEEVLSNIDMAIQFHEAQEPKEPKDEGQEPVEDGE